MAHFLGHSVDMIRDVTDCFDKRQNNMGESCTNSSSVYLMEEKTKTEEVPSHVPGTSAGFESPGGFGNVYDAKRSNLVFKFNVPISVETIKLSHTSHGRQFSIGPRHPRPGNSISPDFSKIHGTNCVE